MKSKATEIENQDLAKDKLAEGEETFIEYGLSEGEGKTYRAIRPFLLPTRFGPLTQIPPGAKVRISEKTGVEAFFGSKVEPLELGDTFEAMTEFTVSALDGTWTEVGKGDILKMTKEEALPLLREGKIREKKGELK